MNGDAASRLAIRISRGSDTIMILSFLDSEVVKIGRGRDCDLQIPDLVVAPHQCDLALIKEGIHLRDQSGAGTVVDGKAVQEATLAPGAVVVLGAIRLELSYNEACGDSLASQLGSCGTEDIPRSGPPVSCPFVLVGVLPVGKKVHVHLGSNLNIGRDVGNDLVINAPDISAFHGRISRRTDGWYVMQVPSSPSRDSWVRSLASPITWPRTRSLSTVQYFCPLLRWISSAPR